MKKYLLMIISLIFLTTFLHSAYTDFGITDVTMQKTVYATDDLNIFVKLINNSSAEQDIDLNVLVYNPDSNLLDSNSYTNSVSPNSQNNYKLVFDNAYLNLRPSTQPYFVKINITNETSGSLSNNSYTKYFTVTKSSKRIPVPEYPVYFSIFIAFFISLYIYRKKR